MSTKEARTFHKSSIKVRRNMLFILKKSPVEVFELSASKVEFGYGQFGEFFEQGSRVALNGDEEGAVFAPNDVDIRQIEGVIVNVRVESDFSDGEEVFFEFLNLQRVDKSAFSDVDNALADFFDFGQDMRREENGASG